MGKLIENYSLQVELGSGVYSKVYKAFNVVTKQQVAIKMVKADKFKELPKLEEGTINQINTLTSLKPCPNIIRYYDMLKTVNNFYFVYEYCNGGTLQKVLKKNGPLTEKQSLIYFKQLVNAFKILAENNIMHRDIKPQNILLHNGILKVADFGFCKPLQHEDGMAETMLGSPIYMAPEVLKGEPYSMKADVWSLGVVLYRMLFGFCPFESNNIGKLILILQENQLKIPRNKPISPSLEQLIRRMLNKDPELRADWTEIFAFQIDDLGEISSKTAKGHESLQTSATGSLNSANMPQLLSVQPLSSRLAHRVESPQFVDPKGYQKMNKKDDSLNPRESLKNESPLRGTLRNHYSKKEVNIKNHKKCLELSQISFEVASFGTTEAIAISYILSKCAEKELNIIKQSVRKDFFPISIQTTSNSKGEDSFISDLGAVINEELRELAMVHAIYEECLNEGGIPCNEVLNEKKRWLKMFIINLQRLEQKQELCLCHQLMDFILEDILINKKTYQKMNSEQMLKKIKDKMSEIY